MIRAGRVSVEGRVERDPERPTNSQRARIAVDGADVRAAARVYIAINKPRGIVVTAADERGRDTVYRLVASESLPWIAPVGRLDRASEGLLLMTNDSAWAARITEPATGPRKTYHVQVSGVPTAEVLAAMRRGITDDGEHLAVASVRILRSGEKNTWLDVELDEGRNRHLRRLLAALDHEVLRLIRVAIGPVSLGRLAKGAWRTLAKAEVEALAGVERAR
jgi:23S rRNA pseudouridine2605 synthase